MAKAVWWVGGDGNIWFKDSMGTRNVGKPINMSDKGFDAQLLSSGSSVGAQRINDPNPQPAKTTQAPANANGQGSGGSSTPKVDKSNDIALQLAGLSALDGQTATGMSAIDKALGGLTSKYDTERSSNEGNYTTQSNTNQGNRQRGTQSSLLNAAQGRQGLFGTLSALGALNGSGVDLANRAVKAGANEDLSGVEDTFNENQTGLDTAIGTFRQQDDMRRKDAETAAEDARTNVRGQAAEKRQSFYANLADNYAAMGNGAESKKYASMAAGEYSNIGKNSIPSSNLAYSAAAFTPGTLADYMVGEGGTVVSATPTSPTGEGGLPGLSAGNRKKKSMALV